MANSNLKLVSGRNGTPVALNLISPPLLSRYAEPEGILTEWHDYISRELNGNRDWVEVGLPWVRWTFFRLSRAEFAFLMTYSGDVTIETLDQTGNAYHRYNGKWKPAEANSSLAQWAADAIGGFSDTIFEVYDLEAL